MATDGRGGRTALIIVAVIALIAIVTYAMGLWSMDATGDLKTPEVSVSATGGEVPNVDVNTATIDVGTKTESVEMPKVEVGTTSTDIKLPTVDITPAENNGKADK